MKIEFYNDNDTYYPLFLKIDSSCKYYACPRCFFEYYNKGVCRGCGLKMYIDDKYNYRSRK